MPDGYDGSTDIRVFEEMAAPRGRRGAVRALDRSRSTYLSLRVSLSSLAHASATTLFGSEAPEKVAHPFFIICSSRCQESTAPSAATKVLLVMDAFSNLLAQMGAKAATIAVVLAASTFSSTVPPRCHPPQPKPIIIVAIAPTTKP